MSAPGSVEARNQRGDGSSPRCRAGRCSAPARPVAPDRSRRSAVGSWTSRGSRSWRCPDLVALDRPCVADQLGREQRVRGFGQGAVLGVAGGSDRGDRGGFGHALGVAHRGVLGGSTGRCNSGLVEADGHGPGRGRGVRSHGVHLAGCMARVARGAERRAGRTEVGGDRPGGRCSGMRWTCRYQEQKNPTGQHGRGGSTRCPRGDTLHTHTAAPRFAMTS
jgi:hypothetical protein